MNYYGGGHTKKDCEDRGRNYFKQKGFGGIMVRLRRFWKFIKDVIYWRDSAL